MNYAFLATVVWLALGYLGAGYIKAGCVYRYPEYEEGRGRFWVLTLLGLVTLFIALLNRNRASGWMHPWRYVHSMEGETWSNKEKLEKALLSIVKSRTIAILTDEKRTGINILFDYDPEAKYDFKPVLGRWFDAEDTRETVSISFLWFKQKFPQAASAVATLEAIRRHHAIETKPRTIQKWGITYYSSVLTLRKIVEDHA